MTITLSADYVQTTGTDKSFYVTGGGAKFQLGSQVSRAGQTNIGLGSVAANSLGNSITGYLSSLGSAGAHTTTIHPSGRYLTVNTSFNGIEVVEFPNVFLFFRPMQAPTGGTIGSTQGDTKDASPASRITHRSPP